MQISCTLQPRYKISAIEKFRRQPNPNKHCIIMTSLSQNAHKILSAETRFMNTELRDYPSWDNVTTLWSFFVSDLRPLYEYRPWILKYTVRLQANIKEIEQKQLVLLVTDSKGFQLKAVDASNSSVKINYFAKPGASAQSKNTFNQLFDSLKALNEWEEPIIFLWLGTCDFTQVRQVFDSKK